MNSAIFTGQNVIVQGITGTQGAFHTQSMRDSGTNIIAGTSPNKAGQTINSVPVYANISDIQQDFQVDISIIFVPAKFAMSAVFEAIDAKIPLIVCITEGIPVRDMLQIRQHLVGESSLLIGPNCPGVILPGFNNLGIIPEKMSLAGNVGIVSRSGTLTYEAMSGLSARGIGQKYVIGIGGDPVRGTGFVECLEMFQNDPAVDKIVLIGEIGGNDENIAADYIRQHVSKPVFAYIAGHTAPEGVQLGHAGAILGSAQESASAKTSALAQSGAHTSTSIVELVNLVSRK